MTNDNIPRPVAWAIRNGVSPTKAFRIYTGISVDRLAEESGLPAKRVAAIETGLGLTDYEAERLSDILEVPTAILQMKPKRKR